MSGGNNVQGECPVPNYSVFGCGRFSITYRLPVYLSPSVRTPAKAIDRRSTAVPLRLHRQYYYTPCRKKTRIFLSILTNPTKKHKILTVLSVFVKISVLLTRIGHARKRTKTRTKPTRTRTRINTTGRYLQTLWAEIKFLGRWGKEQGQAVRFSVGHMPNFGHILYHLTYSDQIWHRNPQRWSLVGSVRGLFILYYAKRQHNHYKYSIQSIKP